MANVYGNARLIDASYTDNTAITSTDIFTSSETNLGATFYVLCTGIGTFKVQALLFNQWVDLTSDATTADTLLIVDVSYALPSEMRVHFTPPNATGTVKIHVYGKNGG